MPRDQRIPHRMSATGAGIPESIADRCHVSTTRRGIIRAVYNAFGANVRHARTWRQWRHTMYRLALRQHAINQRIYQHVNGGMRWKA